MKSISQDEPIYDSNFTQLSIVISLDENKKKPLQIKKK